MATGNEAKTWLVFCAAHELRAQGESDPGKNPPRASAAE
jgi:hypothetical protein